MRKKNPGRKIPLHRETVRQLDSSTLEKVAAASGGTCASKCTTCCPPTTTTK
jgi:hypothetical protein